LKGIEEGDFKGVQNVHKQASKLWYFLCCATTKSCYKQNHPTFSAYVHLLVWPSSHLGLIHEMIPLYSHCHSYYLMLLLLPVLPLDLRVQMSTRNPSVWMVVAAGHVNPTNALAYPHSTS
jgi:hypothetical protein